LIKGRKLEEICVVYPYSNDFSTRSSAKEATSRGARVLSYHLKSGVRGLGEYHLDALKSDPAAEHSDLWAALNGNEGIHTTLKWKSGLQPGILARKLTFDQAMLYIFISESGQDETVHFIDDLHGREYRLIVPENRIAMFCMDLQGEIICSYRDMQVEKR
jgi:hypothetical protein